VTRTDLEERLHRTAWPDVSVELRARVMASAPPHERAIAWIDRVWFSRAWRMSVAAAAAAVVLVGQWAAARPQPAFPRDPAFAQRQALDELVHQAGLPREDAASLVQRALSRRSATSASNLMIDQLLR
jgi:hypothetical protein